MPTTVADLPASAEPVYHEDTIQASLWTNEQRANISWWVPYSDVDAFVSKVFGNFESIGYTYGAMVRRVPLRHPRYPALLASNVRVEYNGFTETPPNYFDRYTIAKCEVEFAIPAYPISGNTPYMVMTKQTTGEVLTIPNFQLKYASSGKPVQQDVGYWAPVSYIDVQIHQMQVPEPPGLAAVESAPLNSQLFATPWRTYPIGRVQYVSDSCSMQFNQGGFPTFQFGVRFKARSALRWDYRLVENGTGTDQVVLPGGAGFIPMSDLNLLFAF